MEGCGVQSAVEIPNDPSTPIRGEPSWVRTSDLLIKSQLLYQLSYGPDRFAT